VCLRTHRKEYNEGNDLRIEDYEFEELKTRAALADLLVSVAEQIREGKNLELPMPTLKEGTIVMAIGEPIETEIEVSLRKHFTHVKIGLEWEKPESKEE
jgi:amphi-Trp domain-containing protein